VYETAKCNHLTLESGGLSRKVGTEDVSYGGSAHVMHSFLSIVRIIKSKQHLSLWKAVAGVHPAGHATQVQTLRRRST
jgi:hypothetical protein